MTIATLADIITKVRRLTGSGNSLQLTEDQIKDYINSYYLYDLPAEFRNLKIKDIYTFNTQRGIDKYAFDSERYTTVEMPAYCAKREIKMFFDPWSFYGTNFNWQYQQNIATGNGTSGASTGTITAATNAANCQITSANHGLVTGAVVRITDVTGMTQLNGNIYTITVDSINTFLLNVDSTAFGVYAGGGDWTTSAYQGFTTAHPIIRSDNNDPTNINFPAGRVQNVLITANVSYGYTVNVTDLGDGTNIGTLIQYMDDGTYLNAGFINYETGFVSVSFFNPSTQTPQNIPQGASINIQYDPQVLAIPLSIMFFQDQFTVRPVPDKGYTIEMVAYRQPTFALELAPANTGVPELREWWELLAFGAAKKIYEDRLDPDGVALMDKSIQERYGVVRTRTYAEIGKQRINTLFADQLQYNYGQSGWGFGVGP